MSLTPEEMFYLATGLVDISSWSSTSSSTATAATTVAAAAAAEKDDVHCCSRSSEHSRTTTQRCSGCRSQQQPTSRVEESLVCSLTSAATATAAAMSLFRATDSTSAASASWTHSLTSSSKSKSSTLSTSASTKAKATDNEKSCPEIEEEESSCACCISSSSSLLSPASHTSNCRLSMPSSSSSSSSSSSTRSRTSSRRNGATNWRTTAFAVLVVFLAFSLRVTEGCSSRSTPKPRPPPPPPSPSPAVRPNITFQTYACPPAYATYYCLNGATCFTIKIGESILYNCECTEGYMGQRCEYKDLEGSYLPLREKIMLERASIAGGATVAVILVVILSIVFYTYVRQRRKENRLSSVQVTVEKLERRNLSFSSCSSNSGGSCRCGVKSGVSVLLQQHQFILPAGGNQGNHAKLTNVDARAYTFRPTDFGFDPINSKTETSIAEQAPRRDYTKVILMADNSSNLSNLDATL